MEEKDFVASLRKGVDVLTCFGRSRERLTVTQVARATGATPAAARRSILTLQAMGFIDGDDHKYWLLPRTLLFAHSYLTSSPLPSLAQPFLDALSERTREATSIGMLMDEDAIVVARSAARRCLSTGLGIGSRLPLYCSALGKVLLASMPQEEVQRRVRGMDLRMLTSHTTHTPEAVIELIDDCRKLGYATNDEELERGVRSLAVPVYSRGGTTIAAMSIAVRSERTVCHELRHTYLPLLLSAREELASRLFDS